MQYKVLTFVFTGMLLLAGCNKSAAPAAGETATVNLKDGTSFSGSVVKSDNSAITLQGDNGTTRTYPMSQVDSVKYADASQTAPPAPVSSTTDSAKSSPMTPAPASAAPGTPAPVPVRYTTIPAGTVVHVRNSDTINSETAATGQAFPAVVTEDVVGEDGSVAVPKGSDATLIIRSASGQGKVQGQSELAVDLDSVTVQGRRYTLETADIQEAGKQGIGKNKRSAKFIGGGAVLGTIIGAVAGGGKGAAIGAAAGGGAGATAQALTRGTAVRIPAESVLSFKLEAKAEIRPLQ